MALTNTVVWVFSADLGETIELGDVTHTDTDGVSSGQDPDKQFAPLNATPGELRKGAKQYYKLTQAQADALQFLPADQIPVVPEWQHVAGLIIIGKHDDFAGPVNEQNLPALAKARLQKLRAGNPTMGLPL